MAEAIQGFYEIRGSLAGLSSRYQCCRHVDQGLCALPLEQRGIEELQRRVWSTLVQRYGPASAEMCAKGLFGTRE